MTTRLLGGSSESAERRMCMTRQRRVGECREGLRQISTVRTWETYEERLSRHRLQTAHELMSTWNMQQRTALHHHFSQPFGGRLLFLQQNLMLTWTLQRGLDRQTWNLMARSNGNPGRDHEHLDETRTRGGAGGTLP